MCKFLSHLFQYQTHSDRKARRNADEDPIRRVDTRTVEKSNDPSSQNKITTIKQKANLVVDIDRIASGQAILSLFGKWLFEAINIEVSCDFESNKLILV